MANIQLKIPNILSAEDSEIVNTFLKTEERMHNMYDLIKENNKKKQSEKKREAKEAMKQKCLNMWANTEEYKKYINK